MTEKALAPSATEGARPLCQVCNKRLAQKGRAGKFQKKCDRCYRTPERQAIRDAAQTRYRKPWSVYKKDTCEECGFVPVHSCQLGVDHIDGNKKNNDPENLMTLCHNCHALKTYLNKDYLRLGDRTV